MLDVTEVYLLPNPPFAFGVDVFGLICGKEGESGER